MSISLAKGGNVSLSKEAPGLTKIMIGLGWDARATDGEEFDLDASAFLLADNDRVRSDEDFVFYNKLQHFEGAVEHMGDNRSGDGDGDDEVIRIDLSQIAASLKKIAISVTIDRADERRQNFGMVQNAFVRVVDDVTGREITRYDLNEDASVETAIIFGEVYRHNNDWKFRAVGQGFKGGLGPLARNYGVNVG